MNAPTTPGPMTVGHDGPSRPIITAADGTMLSVSAFVDGRWQSYDREEADAHLFAAAHDMREVLRSFSVTGPDADALFWLRFKVGGREAAISCHAGGIIGGVVDEFHAECAVAVAKAEGRAR